MKCSSCGGELKDDSLYCSYCGSRVIIVDQQKQAQTQAAQQAFERGKTYFDKGNFEEAIKALDEAISLSENPEYYAWLARAYNRKGEIAAAANFANKSIRLDSTCALAYQQRGDVHRKQKNYAEAIQDFTQAIHFNPTDSVNYLKRAYAYRDQEKYPEAIKDLSKVIELNPTNRAYLFKRAIVYYWDGQHDNAHTDLNQAIYLDPLYTDAYLLDAAILLHGKQDYRGAISRYDFVLKLWWDQKQPLGGIPADLFNDYGVCLQNLGEDSKAISYFEKAIAQDPKCFYAYSNRGRIKNQQKRWLEAIQDFNKAITLDPSRTGDYINRGYAYGESGNYQRATDDCKKALSLAPDDETALQNLRVYNAKLKTSSVQEQNIAIIVGAMIAGMVATIMTVIVTLILIPVSELTLIGFCVGVVIGAILFTGVLGYGFLCRCPMCHVLFGEIKVGSDELSRQKGYKTIERTGQITDREGKIVGEYNRQEQVRVMNVQYKDHYKCRLCGYRWTGISSKEYQDFRD